MNKAAAGLFLLALVFFGIWYFYSTSNNPTFTFQTSTSPGTVYKRILYWEFKDLEKEKDRNKIPFSEIKQVLSYQEEEFVASWKISPLNDSITEVTAKFEAADNNRNKFPFSGSSLPQDQIETEILLLTEAFEKDRSFYKIKLEGKAISPGAICACIPLSSTIEEKASLMMANIQFLSDFISENDLKMAGKPLIKVNKWNIEKDRIEYDFCFPLVNPEGIEGNEKIFLKEIEPQESLKATFNGNYMYSNLGWMALLNYAQAHEIPVQKRPLEVFHDNPEMGGDALEWRTEIFLPIDPK